MDINKSDLEDTCKIFIDTVNHYFNHLTSKPSNTGIPFIKDRESLSFKGYTGMIAVSGSKKGFIFITGNQGLYGDLIKRFIGIESNSSEDLLDMAGELSNVIAGNLRETFGSDFIISVPVVFEGAKKELPFSSDTTPYVIPIEWNNHEANLVIGIE